MEARGTSSASTLSFTPTTSAPLLFDAPPSSRAFSAGARPSVVPSDLAPPVGGGESFATAAATSAAPSAATPNRRMFRLPSFRSAGAASPASPTSPAPQSSSPLTRDFSRRTVSEVAGIPTAPISANTGAAATTTTTTTTTNIMKAKKGGTVWIWVAIGVGLVLLLLLWLWWGPKLFRRKAPGGNDGETLLGRTNVDGFSRRFGTNGANNRSNVIPSGTSTTTTTATAMNNGNSNRVNTNESFAAGTDIHGNGGAYIHTGDASQSTVDLAATGNNNNTNNNVWLPQLDPNATEADVMEMVKRNSPCFVMYTMDGCGWCTKTYPEFEAASQRLRIPSLVVNSKSIPNDRRPEGYPHIFLQQPDGSRHEFTNPTRSMDAFIQFVESHLAPALQSGAIARGWNAAASSRV